MSEQDSFDLERPQPDGDPVVLPPIVEYIELDCPDGTVPGWLDENGNATSCVGDASRGRRHHHDDDETHAPMSRFEKIFLTLMVIGFLLVLGNAVQKWNATPQPTSYDVQLPTL